MTNRKNHNSIIFLTTLSVYLGLVLVGGVTPSVFAQAAAAQKFDVKSEIKVKDDLDKNPDENDLFAASIINLVQELDKFTKKKKFDWNLKNEYQVDSLSFCESDDLPSYMGGGNFDQLVFKKLDKLAIEIARKLFTRESQVGLGNVHSHTIDYKFVFENKTLTINAKISNINERDVKDIQPFATELTNYLAQLTSNSKPTKEKIVAENTKITFENNQVFIVTRLARASIDELLADKTAR